MGSFASFMSAKAKRTLIAVVIGLVSGVFAVIFSKTPIMSGFEWKLLDLRYDIRHTFAPPQKVGEGAVRIARRKDIRDDIVIAAIDSRTLSKMGRFPFPRRVYKELMEQVFKKQKEGIYPEAVLFDIVFSEKSNPEDDKVLVEGFKAVPNDFVNYVFESGEMQMNLSGFVKKAYEVLTKRFSFPVPEGDSVPELFRIIVPPLPGIVENVDGAGAANISPDDPLSTTSESVYRWVPLIIKFRGRYYPSTLLLMAMHYYRVPPERVEIVSGKRIILHGAEVRKVEGVGKNIKVSVKTNDIEIPVDEYNRMMVNYRAKPWSIESFRRIPFYDIWAGRVPPEFFNRKFVLVGVYATGVAKDIWNSPFGSMFGIEHLANGLNTLLNRDFMSNVPSSYTDVATVIFGLLIGFLMSKVRVGFGAVLWVLMLVLTFALSFYLFHKNLVMNTITPLAGLLISYIAVESYIVGMEQREKKMVKATFARYVSAEIVNELLKDPSKIELGGEEKELTIMFSDVRGFTSISEKMTPHELVSHLNEYLSEMTNIVIKNRGTLDKYIGDAIMAFWGAPVPLENHAELACLTAIEMMDKLEELNAHWPPERRLNIGIGVNSGVVTVGNIGSEKQMNYTVMGDNVNLASRLEGVNKVFKTNIIISEFTYEKVKDKFVVRELDLIRVKGKQKPVRIYELIGTVEDVKRMAQENGLDINEILS